MLNTIKTALDKGHSIEIHKTKNGVKVYEVAKKVIAAIDDEENA